MNTNTNHFEIVCNLLEQQEHCENATCHFDGMSGGFKFSDEFPGMPSDINDLEFFHAYIGALRSLWAYRISVVLGNTRNELEEIWQRIKKAAPNWPGFRKERMDVSMLSFAKECVNQSAKLADDLDELDRKMTAAKNSGAWDAG